MMTTVFQKACRGCAVVGGLLLAHPAGAADVVSPVTPDPNVITTKGGWTLSISPYFWAARISGESAQFGLPTVDIDESFGDILSDLDFAAMVIGEARYDRYSIVGDVIYSKISTGSATPRGVLATGVDLTSETFVGLIGAGYSVIEGSAGHLDIVGGAKVWSVNTDVSINGGVLGGISASDSATWVDGVVGLRALYSFTPEVYLTGWGVVGAGGADIDWDVAAALGYRFNDRFSFIAGYRALGVNYSQDDFVFDVVQQGPILGLVMHF